MEHHELLAEVDKQQARIAELEAQLERKDKVVQVLARVFQSGSSCENCPLRDGDCTGYSGCDDAVIKWAEQEVDNAVT